MSEAKKTAPKTPEAPAAKATPKADPKPEVKTDAPAAAPTDAAAEAAVMNAATGAPVPATQADADASPANTLDPASAGAAQAIEDGLIQPYDGKTITDPLAQKEDEPADDDGAYEVAKGFRFKDDDGDITGEHGTRLNLTPAQAKTLMASGHVKKAQK